MQSKPLTLLEEIAVYTAYRAKIVAEDVLVNARMSWMLWAEAILFAMWGSIVTASIGRSKTISQFSIGAELVINAIGFYIALGSMYSLNAAYSEIQSVIEEYSRAYPSLYNCNGRVPSLSAGKNQFDPGFRLSKSMPKVFLFMQCAAALSVIASFFLPGIMFGR